MPPTWLVGAAVRRAGGERAWQQSNARGGWRSSVRGGKAFGREREEAVPLRVGWRSAMRGGAIVGCAGQGCLLKSEAIMDAITKLCKVSQEIYENLESHL